jgi:hypothetical protein
MHPNGLIGIKGRTTISPWAGMLPLRDIHGLTLQILISLDRNQGAT